MNAREPAISKESNEKEREKKKKKKLHPPGLMGIAGVEPTASSCI
jgi:hypothetical protein